MNAMRAMGMTLLALPGWALAASIEAGRAESAIPAVPGGGLLAQLTLGLVAVLAVAMGLSWLLRRYAVPRDGLIRVVGGLPLGSRERLLLIEVGGTRLLLGVTASQIQTLHVLAPPASQAAETTPFHIAPLPPPEFHHDVSKF